MKQILAKSILHLSKNTTKLLAHSEVISGGEQGGVTSWLYLCVLGNAFSAVSRGNNTNCIAVPPPPQVTGHYVLLIIRRISILY